MPKVKKPKLVVSNGNLMLFRQRLKELYLEMQKLNPHSTTIDDVARAGVERYGHLMDEHAAVMKFAYARQQLESIFKESDLAAAAAATAADPKAREREPFLDNIIGEAWDVLPPTITVTKEDGTKARVLKANATKAELQNYWEMLTAQIEADTRNAAAVRLILDQLEEVADDDATPAEKLLAKLPGKAA